MTKKGYKYRINKLKNQKQLLISPTLESYDDNRYIINTKDITSNTIKDPLLVYEQIENSHEKATTLNQTPLGKDTDSIDNFS